MKKSKVFLTIRTLKEERVAAPPERQAEIDEEVKILEPGLSHEEAVYIVRVYESGLDPAEVVQAYSSSVQPGTLTISSPSYPVESRGIPR